MANKLPDPRIEMSRSQFERIVAGAIKCAIDAHGPVTVENRSSAAKRVVVNVFAYFNDRQQQGSA